MTVVLMEGWDLRTNLRAWVQSNGGGFANNNHQSFVAPRVPGSAHGSSFRLTVGSDAYSVTTVMERILPATSTEVVLGFGFNLDEGAYSIFDLRTTYRGVPIVRLVNAAGAIVGAIGVDASNYIILYGFGGSWTTPFQATPATWNYYEIRVKVAGASGQVSLHINGGDSGLGVKADSNGSSPVRAVQIYSQSDGSLTQAAPQMPVTTDDIYVVDCTVGGAPTNTFLGDSVIETIMPSGVGAHSGLTPLSGANWTNVDEIPADGDTSYVSSPDPGTIDTYQFENLSVVSGSVYAIQPNILARKDDAGTRQIVPVMRVAGTDYLAPVVATLSTSHINYYQIVPVNPATGAAWTLADVNNAEFGVKVVA